MTDRIASRVSEIESSAVLQMLEKARRLEASGVKLTYLVRGEPDFDTPAHVCHAAAAALQAGHTHYAPPQGIPELRQAVSNRMLRDFGLAADPEEEVTITTGATQGIALALLAVANPGDEVILFDPVYDPYLSVVRLAGGVPVRVRAEAPAGRFMVHKEAIEAALTRRTKAILVNNPWNPTGTVMTADELRVLVDVAEAHDLVLIVDELYEKITFDGRVHCNLASLSPQARARAITVNSFSKTYAMTGWRLGYNVATPAWTRAMRLIAEQFSRCATTFVQHAGVAALNGPQEPVGLMRAAYARRRELVIHELSHMTGRFHPPEGTFFALLDIRPFKKDSQSVAQYLLESAHVVTVPGSLYGPAGEGFIRLSFAYRDDTLSQGINAIVKCLETL